MARRGGCRTEIGHGTGDSTRRPEEPGNGGTRVLLLPGASYADGQPQSRRADFGCENVESARKLQRLKSAIRDSGFPVHEDFGSPEELEKLVVRDMTATIERLFPEDQQPVALDVEAAEHDAYATSRRRVYIGWPAHFRTAGPHGGWSGCQAAGDYRGIRVWEVRAAGELDAAFSAEADGACR